MLTITPGRPACSIGNTLLGPSAPTVFSRLKCSRGSRAQDHRRRKGEAPDSAQMNAKVREMISVALQSDGVEEIFKLGEDGATEIDIFGDDYLAKIEKIKLPNTKIKLLQQLLKRAIEDFKKINKIKGVDFTKQFQALVNKYNERDEKDVLRSEVLLRHPQIPRPQIRFRVPRGQAHQARQGSEDRGRRQG